MVGVWDLSETEDLGNYETIEEALRHVEDGKPVVLYVGLQRAGIYHGTGEEA